MQQVQAVMNSTIAQSIYVIMLSVIC